MLFMIEKTLIYFYLLFISATPSYAIVIDIEDSTDIYIEKKFYGVNISPHVPLPSAQVIKELGVGIIRIGGNEFDAFNWQNSYVFNPEYGYVKMQSLESIVSILEKSDVEPLFQVNLLGNIPLKKNGAWTYRNKFKLKQLTDLLRKFNTKEKTRLKNFSLGNEFDHWHDTHKYFFKEPKAFSADNYIDRYIEAVVHMKKIQYEINKRPQDISLWGPEISTSYNGWQTDNIVTDCKYLPSGTEYSCSYGKNGKYKFFIPYFLSRLKDKESEMKLTGSSFQLLNYLSFHYYPIFRTNIKKPKSIIIGVDEKFIMEKALNSSLIFSSKDLTNSIDKSSQANTIPNIFNKFNSWINIHYPDARLALTEFGVDPDDRVKTYPAPLRSLYFASVLGQAINSNLGFINKFRLNSISPNIAPWSLIKDKVKTPHFYIMKMFTHHMRGKVLKVKQVKEKDIQIYATKFDDIVNVVLINMSSSDRKSLKIKINKSSVLVKLNKFSLKLIKYNLKSKKYKEIIVDVK